MFSFLQNQKIAVLILIFSGVLVYANSLPNAMFWDDSDFILNNQFVRNFDLAKIFSENIIAGAGFISNYFRPILSVVFAIEWRLFGEWAIGYHAVNTIFHILNGLILFFILKKIFALTAIPFFVSLIFIIHPTQTEAVIYANSLGDSLSVFLMFLSIFFYLKPNILMSDVNKLGYYFLALFLYVLALLSKETAIILPVLLVLYEITKKYKNTKDVALPRFRIFVPFRMFVGPLLKLLPFLIIAGIYIYLRATLWNFDNTFNFYDQPDAYTENVWVRIFTFLRVLTLYFSLLIAPVQLHYERTADMATSFFSLDVIVAFLIVVILGLIAFIKFFKEKKPEYLFALGWFFIGLAPTSGILAPINNYLYEHWLYLPMIGFFLFFGFYSYEITKKYKNTKYIVGSIIGIFIIFLATQTIKRNAEWRKPIKFYLQTLEFSPKSGRAWNNLGTEYAKIGKLEEAKNAYLESIKFISQNPGPYNNLGNVFAALGKLDTAAEYWEKSVAINPDFLPPRQALEQYYAIKEKISAGEKINIRFNE